MIPSFAARSIDLMVDDNILRHNDRHATHNESSMSGIYSSASKAVVIGIESAEKKHESWRVVGSAFPKWAGRNSVHVESGDQL